MSYTRRDLGRLTLATVPALGVLSLPRLALAKPDSKIRGVQLGVITYSFRQGVPKNEIVADIAKIGLSEVELMSGDAEAMAGAPPAPAGGFGGGRGGRGRGAPQTPLTPEQQAQQAERQKAQAEYQKAITEWRMKTTDATWAPVKKQFHDAGIDLHVLCYNMGANIKDEEIEHAFQMAKALGVKSISSSSTVSVAKRVAPIAEKHKMFWGGHGHDDVADPEQFATPETFEKIMAMSKYIGTNLDIGHFTAARFDPIAFIQKHHDRITNLHLKDRKHNPEGPAVEGRGPARGANVPWGEGDTPIKEVLLLLRKEKYNFPANIELEYPVPEGSNPVAEVTKCYEYAKKILES